MRNLLKEIDPYGLRVIIDVDISDYELFERIVDMEKFPREELRKIRELLDGVIVV